MREETWKIQRRETWFWGRSERPHGRGDICEAEFDT